MRLFLKNVSYQTNEDDLRALFEQYGKVASVRVPVDRFSGRPRGLAFVDMPNMIESRRAIAELNGRVIRERALSVEVSRENE